MAELGMACERCVRAGPPIVADVNGTPSHVQVWHTRTGPTEVLFACADSHLYKEFVAEYGLPHCYQIGRIIERLEDRKHGQKSEAKETRQAAVLHCLPLADSNHREDNDSQ